MLPINFKTSASLKLYMGCGDRASGPQCVCVYVFGRGDEMVFKCLLSLLFHLQGAKDSNPKGKIERDLWRENCCREKAVP